MNKIQLIVEALQKRLTRRNVKITTTNSSYCEREKREYDSLEFSVVRFFPYCRTVLKFSVEEFIDENQKNLFEPTIEKSPKQVYWKIGAEVRIPNTNSTRIVPILEVKESDMAHLSMCEQGYTVIVKDSTFEIPAVQVLRVDFDC